jgi:hypothetical protein
MATYVNDLRLKEIATGDESGTWGTSTNTNLELIGEALGFGTEAITTNADTHTTTVADGSTDPGRAMYLKYTGTLDSACTITIAPNTISRMHFIENGTSGSQNIIISQGSGANVTIPAGDVKAVYLDGAGSGAAVTDAFASLNVVDLKVQDDLTVTDDATIGGTLGVTGTVTLAGDIDLAGGIDVDGTSNLDIVDIDGAVDMASTLQVDGAITSSAGATITVSDNSDNLTLTSTDADANSGPNLRMYRNSGSPADDDFLGQIDFEGRNNNSQDVVYGKIYSRIMSPADGSEDSNLYFELIKSGTNRLALMLDRTEAVFNDDSQDINFRVESDGNANMLFVDGGLNQVGIATNDFNDMGSSSYAGLKVGGATFQDSGGGNGSATHILNNSYVGSGNNFYLDGGGASSGIQLTSGDINFFTFDGSGGSADAQVSYVSRLHIDQSGRIGIGTTAPAFTNGSGLEIERDGPATLRLTDTGSSGKVFEIFTDDATGNQLKGLSSGLGMLFGVINAEAMRITTSKNLCIGSTSNTGVGSGGLRLVYGSGESDGDTFFIANGGASNAQAVTMLVVQGEGFNTNHGALHVGRHTGNSRSINAGGSINASGADYAEYMLKSDGCADIAKGEVCGVDADGKLTKTFSAAKSFVIKSTDPAYVGADTWWTEKEPERYTDEGKTQYTTAWKDWDTRKEAARANVDRVAFCGQVPVNITGSFNVGDYVYPQANGSNIECVAKTTPTFEEYQSCVGKIWTTMDDGRPLVAVKIG